MAVEKPGKDARARWQDDHPGPKRKGRAAVAVLAILFAMIVIIFVARNFQHANELEENPPPATGQGG